MNLFSGTLQGEAFKDNAATLGKYVLAQGDVDSPEDMLARLGALDPNLKKEADLLIDGENEEKKKELLFDGTVGRS